MEDARNEETEANEIDAIEELGDLPVAEDEAAEAKGGTTKSTPELMLACAIGKH